MTLFSGEVLVHKNQNWKQKCCQIHLYSCGC